jgi:hypothetical protein
MNLATGKAGADISPCYRFWYLRAFAVQPRKW